MDKKFTEQELQNLSDTDLVDKLKELRLIKPNDLDYFNAVGKLNGVDRNAFELRLLLGRLPTDDEYNDYLERKSSNELHYSYPSKRDNGPLNTPLPTDDDTLPADYDKYKPTYSEDSPLAPIRKEVSNVIVGKKAVGIELNLVMGIGPGFSFPKELGFIPQKGMKVIYDNEGGFFGENMKVYFYDKDGKKCFFGAERKDEKWKVVYTTPETFLKFVRSNLRERELEEKSLNMELATVDALNLIQCSSPETQKEKEDNITKLRGTAQSRKERIENIGTTIEGAYEQINPDLAALRKKEQESIQKGVSPEEAQKQRRVAVRAYYNNKQKKY